MPSYLQIENISKSYGPKVLFENIAFNINEGDKIALIAPNGTGKTSLLRILAGEDKSDSGGRIIFLKDISIAFLEQDYSYEPTLSISEQIHAHAAPHLQKMHEDRLARFEVKLAELSGTFRLGSLSRRMDSLSGGEVKRVALCEMLALEAEFFIMDEPTNHLDIEAIEALEQILGRSRCTLLMVTHDRYFLDRVCNTVMELDRGSVYLYRGNYQNYLEKRSERIANYNAETDKVRNLLRRELEWIHATPCARTGKAKYRINAFHELSERASQAYVTKQISLDGVGSASRLGNKIINCKSVSYYWEGQCMLDSFTYNFQRCDKIGIVGRNGVGKSTFLDLLTGALEPQSGIIDRGESLRIGYYHQEGISFDPGDTVLDICPDTRLLGRFLFPHDMLSTRIDKLSGGEKRRLYLLTILMKEPNLLILDEPTNDLDIVTLNILEEFLNDYKGSLIVVSHDRHFLDRVVDHLLVFCGEGKVKDFVGKFSEYRSYIKDYEASQKAAAKAVAQSAAQKSGAQDSSSRNQSREPARKERKLSWKESRELEAIEARLPQLEESKAELEKTMSSGLLAYDKLQECSSRIKAVMDEINELEMRWMELQEKL